MKLLLNCIVIVDGYGCFAVLGRRDENKTTVLFWDIGLFWYTWQQKRGTQTGWGSSVANGSLWEIEGKPLQADSNERLSRQFKARLRP
jgi:hypothetical protein